MREKSTFMSNPAIKLNSKSNISTVAEQNAETMKTAMNLKSLASLTNNVDCISLKYCERNKKDDWYLQALKAYYFPFLLKYHNYICILWLCVFVISLVLGPQLLNLTRSNLEVPAGTPTAAALSVFKSNFQEFSTYVYLMTNCYYNIYAEYLRNHNTLHICRWPPVFIVARSDHDSVYDP